jgi:hypothetical protein
VHRIACKYNGLNNTVIKWNAEFGLCQPDFKALLKMVMFHTASLLSMNLIPHSFINLFSKCLLVPYFVY